MSGAFRPTGTGLSLYLRVTPNAKADVLAGFVTRDDGTTRLAVRVAAPPDKGRANTAVIALLAKYLHRPKSAITLVSGETARQKTVAIAGDPDALAARLAALDKPGKT